MPGFEVTESQLELVRERYDELQDEAAVEALRGDRLAQVVRLRWSDLLDEGHRPEPYWQQMLGRLPRVPSDEPRADGWRLGVDGARRVVVAEEWADGAATGDFEAITWHADRIEVAVAGPDAVREVRVLWVDGTTQLHQVVCDGRRRLDGRCAVDVTVYDVRVDGTVDRAVHVYESGADGSWEPELGPCWIANATVFLHEDGDLVLVEHLSVGGRVARNGDVHVALAQAREALVHPERRDLVWDGRLLTPVTETADPDRALDGLAEPLADALQAAVDGVRHRIGQLAFVYVRVEASSDADRPHLLTAAAGGTRFVARAGARGFGARRALDMAGRGADDAAALDVLAVAPAPTLARVRAGLQALGGDWPRARAAAQRLAGELASELDRRRWPAPAPGFVTLVCGPDADDRADGFDVSRAVSGAARVDALLAVLAGERPADGDRPADVPPTIEDRCGGAPAISATRDELADLLVANGVAVDGARRAADDAAWAIVLEDGGGAETRIGGRPCRLARSGRAIKDARSCIWSRSRLPSFPGSRGARRCPVTGRSPCSPTSPTRPNWASHCSPTTQIEARSRSSTPRPAHTP